MQSASLAPVSVTPASISARSQTCSTLCARPLGTSGQPQYVVVGSRAMSRSAYTATPVPRLPPRAPAARPLELGSVAATGAGVTPVPAGDRHGFRPSPRTPSPRNGAAECRRDQIGGANHVFAWFAIGATTGPCSSRGTRPSFRPGPRSGTGESADITIGLSLFNRRGTRFLEAATTTPRGINRVAMLTAAVGWYGRRRAKSSATTNASG